MTVLFSCKKCGCTRHTYDDGKVYCAKCGRRITDKEMKDHAMYTAYLEELENR